MAYLEVIESDGSSKGYTFEGQSMLGRSPNVAVSIPTNLSLDEEHILFAPRKDEGCWVSVAKDVKERVLFKGQTFSSGMVPWGSSIEVAGLTIKIFEKQESDKKEGVSPVLLIAMAIAAAYLAFLFLYEGSESIPSSKGLKAPAIFEKSMKSSCNTKGDAMAQGEKREWEGDARGDRYPYDNSEGVRATLMYAEAAACFRKGGDVARAKRAENKKDDYQAKVEADYAASRLRLQRAISSENNRAAIKECDNILQLISQRKEDKYAHWIKDVKRIVESRLLDEQRAKE